MANEQTRAGQAQRGAAPQAGSHAGSRAGPQAGYRASGFPSPAEDVAESSLDLQALMAPRPAATFFLRMRGDAMRGAGVFAGDILVVDRSLRPAPRRLVALAIGGELRVRRYLRAVASYGVIFVAAGDGVSEAVPLGDDGDATQAVVWGVVTYVIHQADTFGGDVAGDVRAGDVRAGGYADVRDAQ